MTTERNQLVRNKAYELWERDGRPEGQADRYWHEAEGHVGTSGGDTKSSSPADEREGGTVPKGAAKGATAKPKTARTSKAEPAAKAAPARSPKTKPAS